MKLVLCTGLALVLSTSIALADQFAGMYGNTVVQKEPDGKTSTIYVNADGTWEQHKDGKTVSGTYTWKDDTHFCITVTDPPPDAGKEAETSCDNQIDGNHKVGDTWTDTDEHGTTTLSITAGRS